jgi:hypothetical protein
MSPHCSSDNALGEQILYIPTSDRWRIYYRLQELTISCSCPPDGSLWVKVTNLQEAIIVRSILMQFYAPRHELLKWLEHCWNYDAEC